MRKWVINELRGSFVSLGCCKFTKVWRFAHCIGSSWDWKANLANLGFSLANEGHHYSGWTVTEEPWAVFIQQIPGLLADSHKLEVKRLDIQQHGLGHWAMYLGGWLAWVDFTSRCGIWKGLILYESCATVQLQRQFDDWFTVNFVVNTSSLKRLTLTIIDSQIS